MPGVSSPGSQAFGEQLRAFERRIRALETQQQFVITDPTKASGDPLHGHAVVVIGSLKAITGINAYGIASFKTGAWVQL
jgi:hypothetical protein